MEVKPFLQTDHLDIYFPEGTVRKIALEYQVKLYSDLPSMEFLAFRFFSFEEAEARLKNKEANGGTTFLVKLRSTQEPVGICGLNFHDKQHRKAEFGIIIHSNYWRRGFATELHLACFSYYYEKLNIHRIEMNTDVRNYRMRGFCSRIGMRCESILKDVFILNEEYISDACYVLFSDEWPQSKQILQKMKDSTKGPSLYPDNIIYCPNDFTLKIDEFVQLAKYCRNNSLQEKQKMVGEALNLTLNITARLRTSLQIVGSLRILSDGMVGIITDLMVHPEYVNYAVRKGLLQLAKNVSRTNLWFMGECEPSEFRDFEAVGCVRGPQCVLLTKNEAPQ